MKYMLLFVSPTEGDGQSEPSCTVEDWMSFDKEMKDAGVWVSGHALRDLTTCTSLRLGPDGERIVTDGPFAETREVLGGYDVIDVPDLDAALEWAARSPGARDGGSVQVRPIAEFGL
ncbi:YciI family protein [Solwaraspora sp. WMMD406]|uniref:YciI family protein n=1 Tax=Solwaraspora sp. WMMD406 TaxID=3016095 RepID=UPI0024161E80|nr:YciI family protein [Solwaraspora sp. WMMD406]MDG4766751.1 YciI family protein [Solwaraspora sp. WMMD406]